MAREDRRLEKQLDPSEIRPAPVPARAGHPKYDEQVWAGIVDDKDRLADLKAARAPKKPGAAEGTATTASEIQSP